MALFHSNFDSIWNEKVEEKKTTIIFQAVVVATVEARIYTAK